MEITNSLPEFISGIPTAKNQSRVRRNLIAKYYSNLWKRLQREGYNNRIYNDYLGVDVFIIKNESDKPLSARFAVESTIANIFFRNDDKTGFNIETIDNNDICVINSKRSTADMNRAGKLENIQLVRSVICAIILVLPNMY